MVSVRELRRIARRLRADCARIAPELRAVPKRIMPSISSFESDFDCSTRRPCWITAASRYLWATERGEEEEVWAVRCPLLCGSETRPVQLPLRALDDHLLDGAARHEAVHVHLPRGRGGVGRRGERRAPLPLFEPPGDVHLPRLPDPVGAVHRLQVHLRVPVRVVEHDGVRRLQRGWWRR